jgi:kumamolisin
MGSTGTVVMAVLDRGSARRLFCARGLRPPRRGLCVPQGLRGSVRQLVAGEAFTAEGPAYNTSSAAAPATGTPQGCKGALESGAFTPNQIATAYSVDGLHARGLEGDGVRVATMSPARVSPSPLRTWASCFGLPAPSFHQTSMPGASVGSSTAPEETYLDAEALAAVAPRLQRITAVFVPQDLAFQSSFALFMFGALDPSRHGGHLPDVLSISDGACESEVSDDELRIGQHLLRAAAALGTTALAASGDLGFLGCQSGSGASWPASSEYVTAVGGTDMALDPANRLEGQVVWSTFGTEPGSEGGSGGGPSSVWPRDGWQRAPGVVEGLQPGRRTRLTPDLAAMASFAPGLAIYGGYGGWMAPGGGTSAATPLTAGIVALVREQERRVGRPALGAVNRFLYGLARGPLYGKIFWDVTRGTSSPRPESPLGRTPAGGAAQPGYDLATGLGSLNGVAFADAVSSAAQAGAGR